MSSSTPPSSRSNSPSPGTDLSGNRMRKFLNGWTKEQEDLMAEWSDKAACYRWLHDRCEKKYSRYNMSLTIPVIILSTLTGTANFALGSFIPPQDTDMKNYVQAGIGAISIFAGILTTLGNFLRYAQGSESNRVAGIAWGKFQRQIAVELAIHPNERIDSMDFLKICRAELDRLIEQSPPVPDDIINEFEKEFKDIPDIKRPDICHGIEHTKVFRDDKARLKHITSEASLMLMHKKRALRDELVPEVDRLISKKFAEKINDLSGSLIEAQKKVPSSVPYVSTHAVGKYAYYSDDFRHKSALQKRASKDEPVASSDIHIDIVGSRTAEEIRTQLDAQPTNKGERDIYSDTP